MRLLPETWNRGTLKMLVRKALKVCTKDYLLEMELHHLETTFVEINNFPRNVVKRIFKHVRTEMNVVSKSATNNATEENAVEHNTCSMYSSLRGRKGRIHREGI